MPKARTPMPNVKRKERPSTSGPHRTEAQRKMDRAELPRLIRRGWTQGMIAEKLGVSQAMISMEWKVIIKQYKEEANQVTEELIALKLQEYAEIKREAWDAWEKSKQDAEETIEEETISTKANSSKTGTRRKGQCGEAGYLNMVFRCLEAERELQGLNPAKEIKGTINTINWEVLAEGIPLDGSPVPDLVENEIRKALGLPEMLPDSSSESQDNTIYVQPVPKEEAQPEIQPDTEDLA